MICAQCHSLRAVIAPDFTAGADYYDYFQPSLENEPHNNADPSYWVDGRPRRFSNDAIGLWESQCFLRGGATCTSCHTDPHDPDVDRNPQLATSNNRLCTSCHQDIGTQLAAHTRHPVDSAGSSCVECHMPKTVVGVKSTMRDHTISLPAPENTVAFGIPNACTECHVQKNPAWAAGVLKDWWPQMRRAKLIARAQAFAAAQARRPEALERLIAIAGDNEQGPLIQANALGYLGSYADTRATAALKAAAGADHPAIRSAAVSSLKLSLDAARVTQPGHSSQPANEGAARAALLHALDDPRRAVRLSALGSLIKVGGDLDPDGEQRFLRVSREFAAMAHLYEDEANIQSALGVVQLQTGQFDLAATALSNSLSLEPALSSTKFLLALALLGQHRYEDARTLLKQVPRSDPMYRPAQERLQHIDAPAR
jgi:predicted CXXCH cytochrome family protein